MKKFLVMAALSLMGLAAHATEARPLWVCGLHFEGEAQGVQLILGSFRTEAVGSIDCTDGVGGTYHRDVRVTMGNRFLSPAAGIGHFELAGASAEISLFNLHPDVLLGNYVVTQGQGALIGGVGAFTAVKVRPPQVAVQVSLQVMTGWGVHVGVHRMKIEAL